VFCILALVESLLFIIHIFPQTFCSCNFCETKYIIASSLVCAFILTPFLGRKIAYDDEFRAKYIPKWFDYTLNKPKNAWTKEELHEQVVLLQQQLHERAINGEFTPEKLDEMRRNLDKKPEREEYAHFAKLHPGVDDDEDLED
jgi:hypothetical protein